MPPRTSPTPTTDGIAREPERRATTGVPQSTWRALQDEGLAPLPVRLGPHSVGWLRRELLEWVEARRAARDATVLKNLRGKPSADAERDAKVAS
jgi:predicted DNA-binding transcriptional regulator AlpA